MLEGRREFSTIRYILGGRGISIVLIVPGVIPQPLGFLPRKTRRSSRANLFPEYPSHFFLLQHKPHADIVFKISPFIIWPNVDGCIDREEILL